MKLMGAVRTWPGWEGIETSTVWPTRSQARSGS